MPRSAKFRKWFIAILLLAAVVDLTGAQRIPLWDRDEPWYAECTREMVLSGDWVVPRFLGAWRQEKPPMIYWCQAVSIELLGESELAVRLPSTLSIVAATALLGIYVRRFSGDRRAIWSMFIFCSSGLAIAAGKFAITDALLMLSICTGQACLGLMYAAELAKRRPAWWLAPLFWVTLSVAALTKGPVALGMDVVSMIVLLLLDLRGRFRDPSAWKKAIAWWRHTKPLIGVPILLVLGVPWLILLHERAPGFLGGLALKAAKHSGGSMDGHGAPPGYHTLGIFATFFPWSLLLVAVAIIAWRKRSLPMIRFAIAAVVGPWLLMELVWTKLPFYVLPSFPALSFLTADAIIRCARGEFDELGRKSFKVGIAVWAFATVLIGFAPWAASYWAYHQADVSFHTWLTELIHRELPLPIAGMVAFSLGTIVFAGIVSQRFMQGRIERACAAIGLGMMFIIAVLYGTVLPNLDFVQLPKRLAADLPPTARGLNVPMAMIGYYEPSLAYYQGGGARQQDADYLQTTPPDQWPRWMTIDFESWHNVPPSIQRQMTIVAQEWGIDYAAKAKAVGVYVLENPAAK